MYKFSITLILGVFFLFPVFTQANVALDIPFAPVVEGENNLIQPISSHAVQTDGKVLVGGSFSIINSRLSRNFARLNSDGSFDNSFNTGSGPDARIDEIAIQADGKILIGGLFSEYNGVPIQRFARINSDGSLDTSFMPMLNRQVLQIVLQTDGKILIGGDFTNINGTAINRIARLNPDGSLDTTFNPGSGANDTIRAIAVQPDGKILIGGSFFFFNGVNNRYFLRLNFDGSLDATFIFGAGTNSPVNTIALQTDGKIVIGGTFDSYNGVTRNNFARVNSDGSPDTSLTSPFAQSTIINSVDIQTDGKFIILGNFFSLGGQQRNGITRLNTDGTIDTSFTGTGFDNSSNAIEATILPDGKIIASGGIDGYNGNPAIAIVRINSDGSFDNTFNARTGSSAAVYAVTVRADNKILIGGTFGFVNGLSRGKIARLNADGTTDTTFNPGTGVSGFVNEIAVQSDGKILIVGLFSGYNGIARQSIARLNSDGSLDTTFNAGVLNSTQSEIDDVLVTNDGKIVVSGLVFSFNGVQKPGIARLNSDGSLDTSFATVLNSGRVSAIALQPDGKIVIGGLFNIFGSAPRKDIARINADGSLDITFDPGSGTNNIFDIALQPDGKIIIGGFIFTYNGVQRNGVARVNADGSLDTSFDPAQTTTVLVRTVAVDPRGKILIGGDFTQFNGVPTGRVVRLNSDGSRDQTFTIGTGSGGTVYDFGFQGNKLLIGGFITSFNGVLRGGLVRLVETSSNFDYDGDGKSDISVFRPSNGVWYINGSQNGFSALSFGLGTDLIAPADFDGDGKTDVAVFRPSNGTWYYLRSSDNGFAAVRFGTTGDIPIPADFDGDGKADINVFRPANGAWYRLNSSDGQFVGQIFGQNGDKPLIADFDGDGKNDLAVFRPSNGIFYRLESSNGQFGATQFGISTDIPTMGDFDGDSKTDIAVFRPSNGTWYRLNSSDGGFVALSFGQNGDVPVTGDYDGDGKADIAVFRPSNSTWYYLKSSNGGFVGLNFGTNSDKPTPAAFQQ